VAGPALGGFVASHKETFAGMSPLFERFRYLPASLLAAIFPAVAAIAVLIFISPVRHAQLKRSIFTLGRNPTLTDV
jgi:hypothetical protein